jgi:hypothetical protein
MASPRLGGIERMKAGVYEAVMERDGRCVLSFLESGHECRTRYGMPHPPDALEFLTFEHVKEHLAMGIAKVDDARWGVALCGAANARPPTKAQRALFRDYLAYPAIRGRG